MHKRFDVNDSVNFGILGCAKINQVAIIEAAREIPAVQVLAIGSRNPNDAKQYAADNKIDRSYGSYDALLDDPDIDIVYIPLPNHLHEKWATRALNAGKHVLVEKPLAANAEEASRMVKIAQAHSLHLIEAFHYRYHPMMVAILDHLSSGKIGTIETFQINLKVPKSLLEPDDIRLSFDCAGGAVMDLGAYGINLLRTIFAESPTIDSASAKIVAENIDGSMDIKLRFSNDITGLLSCSIVHDSVESLVTIRGTKGVLEAKNPFLPQFGNSLKVTVDGTTTKQKFSTTTTYVYQLQAVADLLLQGKPVTTPGRDGIANMAVLDGIYTAAGLDIRGTTRHGPTVSN
tara:strand:+ start:14421 stop:15455 length:1035 start_codon:yes stop_codon:yes gene_type:complete